MPAILLVLLAIIVIAFVKEYFVFIALFLGLIVLTSIVVLLTYLGRRRARIETPHQNRHYVPRNPAPTASVKSVDTSRLELSVDPALAALFREDLLTWATKNFPSVHHKPEKLPDHLRLAYKTGDPRNLPLFGDSHFVFESYVHALSNPSLIVPPDDFLDKFEKECDVLISSHRLSLSREKKRLTRKDAYGNLFEDEWWSDPKGIHYFIDMVLKPSLGQEKWTKALALSSASKSHSNLFADLLDKINKAADGEGSADYFFSEDMDGMAYENLCEKILNSKGWNISRTPISGDQGVDIIAEKGDRRVCIQCKRYSSSVGNSAVQEVVAGKLHWGGSHAAVVSNADYTASAKALADSACVFLLHHDDLLSLDDIILNRGIT